MLKAFSILEIVVALFIFSLILLTAGSYTGFSLANLSNQEAVIQAETLAQEAQAVLAVIAKRDWSLFDPNVGSLNYANGQWGFLVSGTVEQIDNFTRRLQLIAVCRDAQQKVVDCSSGTIDSGTYRYIVTIDWHDWAGDHQQKNESYIANWYSL